MSKPDTGATGGRATAAASRARVDLLGRFSLQVDSSPLEVTRDAQRLVAFLALRGRRVPRPLVAGTLWIDNSQERAFGNLRSALWRLRQQVADLIEADSTSLAIADGVDVDVASAVSTGSRLGDSDRDTEGEDLAVEPFLDELLPGWYDDWVLVERERIRQLSLHALESISCRQLAAGRFDAAIEAAWCAVRLDPLRESPHRCLVEIHLAEGNRSEALREYRRYETLLRDELAIAPSSLLRAMIA